MAEHVAERDARRLAQVLEGSSALLRAVRVSLRDLWRCAQNLSEFSHPSKFNRLTGGDPNYVGYKEGGELTNFIRNAEERRDKGLSAVDVRSAARGARKAQAQHSASTAQREHSADREPRPVFASPRVFVPAGPPA